jgi:adenosylcobyric acid synthase
MLEHDDARRALLRWVAGRRGLDFEPAPDVDFGAERERQLDALGDVVEEHLDTRRLLTLIERGVPADLPDLLLERAPC